MIRIISVFILLIICFGLYSQGSGNFLVDRNTKNLIINNFTVKEGLASNSVRKIGQFENGYMLIATYNGISAFDGKNFTNFTSENVATLISSNIYDFCTDSQNQFWFATHNGIVVFDGNEFYRPTGLADMENISVQHVEFDKNGTLWIGTTSNGIFTYSNEKLEKLTKINNIEKSIISLIFADNSGNIWIGNELGSLYKFNGKNFTEIKNTKNTNGIFAACQNKHGDYYFGTRKGLYTYIQDKFILISDKVNFINDLSFDREGRLWIATNAGLYYYNPDRNQLFPLSQHSDLSNQIIQSIFFDNNNMIWIGTYRKGLLQCREGYFENFLFDDIGLDEIPSGVVQLNDSSFLISTDEGTIIEMRNKTLRKLNLSSFLSGNRIKSLMVDKKANIWICSYNGLVKIEGSVKNGKHSIIDLPDKTIRNIVETDDGYFWVGTRQSGIYKIDENLDVLKKINTENQLSSNFVMSLVKGRNGNIFIATKNGIDIMLQDSIIAHYDNHNGLPDNLIFNVFEDEDGIIWIASIKGLSRLEKGKFTNFDSKNGLGVDQIFDVTEDNYGFLWIPTIKGILRVKKSDLNAYVKNTTQTINSALFDQSDGISDAQYVSSSKLLKTRNGNIVINTNAGISILNPLIVNSGQTEPSLLFKTIGSESVSYFVNKNYYEFNSSTRQIQIDYSYIDFLNPDKVSFKYKLEPFDADWQTSDIYRFARYTNLPPGEYTFTLQANSKSITGFFVEKTIKFSISPAFYETWWFKILIVLTIIAMFRFVYILRVKTIKHQKDHLEKVVVERTKEINRQKDAIEKNLEELESQKAEIAMKNEEILLSGNKIEQAYLNLKLLSDLGKEITSFLSEDDIVMAVYQDIESLMDCHLISIGNYIKDDEVLIFNSTIYRGKKINPVILLVSDKSCILNHSLLNNIEIITNNYQRDFPEFQKSYPEISTFKSIASAIVLPIKSKNRIIGVFTVQSFRKDSYSDFHFTMLKNLVNYISIASENSKTYKKIKEQKDELVKVNASKDRMFSIIGHDLRGPVGTIKSFLDIIIENPEMANSENTIEILKSMQQSLGSAYTLLDNLLLWARSQRGQLEFEPLPFYIKQPIDEIIALVSEIAKNKEIEIETKINYNEMVIADQNMITTVIRNLVSNAIKFTPRQGKIIVATDQFTQTNNGKSEEKIEIRIIDNGVGIKKEDLEKILEQNEFFSTHGTDRETGSGLGIGICIDFLKMHKQKLLVYNNREIEEVFNKGTTFKFYLNRSDQVDDNT